MRPYYSRFFFVFIAFLFANSLWAQPWKEHGKLTILKENPHYLTHTDGTAFFWFGDTRWELFHRLDREEAEVYLQDRKEKGFNVIQAVAISEFHKSKRTNNYGDSLFHQDNPLQPVITSGNNPHAAGEYDYWDHVEYVISLAEQKGLFIALLPTWGEWVTPREHSALFRSSKHAYTYGWYLSNRLKRYPNIIWVLGGDRDPDEIKGGLDLWRAMAEGITDAANGDSSHDGKADYGATLMSYHSYTSSSKWFHADPWIDFHTWGSYHSDYYLSRSHEQAEHDRALKKAKPTINSEPNYEDHPVNYAINGNGVFTDVDVRLAAYWTVFSGGTGYTYGAHPVWQFADDLRPAYSELALRSWQQALSLPGANQIIHLKRLMESRSSKNLRSDSFMILEGQGTGANHIPVIKSESHAFIYVPTGSSITVKFGVMPGKNIKASWFDPRSGVSSLIGTFPNLRQMRFNVPGRSEKVQWLRSGRGCDWVLILDTAKN